VEVSDVRTPEGGGSKEFMAGPVRTIFSLLLAALLLALVAVAIRYRLLKNKKRVRPQCSFNVRTMNNVRTMFEQ
jgi:hypothetical protein